MGILTTFEHPGENGGVWFAAQFPMGATRYYSTVEARTDAISRYTAAIESTGGHVLTVAAPISEENQR